MNITSDKEGEIIAFGTTVPYITPSTSTSQIEEHCAFLVSRLVSAVGRNHIVPDKYGIVAVPTPIAFKDSDSLFSVQETSMRTVLAMTRSLSTHGYTTLSCTPAALADNTDYSTGVPTNILVGNVLLIAKHADAAKYVASFEHAGVAGVWTEYADAVYGKAAINRVMSEMHEQLRAATGQKIH